MTFGSRKSYQIKEGIVYLQFEQGQGQIEILTDEIVNVFAPVESGEHRSKAVEGDKSQHIYFESEERIDHLELRTKKLIIRVYDDFKVDFYNRDGIFCVRITGDGGSLIPPSVKILLSF